MHVEEADTPALKKWIVKRLEDVSDADSDVLADYVLALVKSEDPDDQVRSNCLENLEDFLRDNTGRFVDDIFSTVRTKSYVPGHAVPQGADSVAAPSFNPPSGPANDRRPSAQFHNGMHGGGADQSRKRTWNERAGSESRDVSMGGGAVGAERAMKQVRRGNYQGPGGRGGRHGHHMGGPGLPGLGQPPIPALHNMPPMPTPPPGFPPIDPNNPLSAIMTMQALGFPPMPGMPQLPLAGSPPNYGQGRPTPDFAQTGSPPPRRVGERCRDYDQKGFCALGSVCPYEHGVDPIVVATDEYDPKSAAIDTRQPSNGYTSPGPRHHYNDRGTRGSRGRGRGDRPGRGGRAPFSSAGPNHDRSIQTIVVEQIPEDKFNEEAVREFFSEFGNIEEITMQAYKRLALVKFEDYWAARRAYDSPKVIFDNRFVKVYWFKPDASTGQGQGANGQVSPGEHGAVKREDEEMVDMAEVEKRQAEAQRMHEEKLRKLKEAEIAREELDKKLKAQAEERKKLLEKLSAKTAGKAQSATPTNGAGSPVKNEDGTPAAEDKKKTQTEALRAKLAELEAEAESMGINPDDSYSPGSSHRGRAGYRGTSFRGRGSFPPRGRGYDPSYRGGYRGRGGFVGSGFGGARGGVAGAVKRLDNRPKRVAVASKDGEWTSEKDEALRSYLFNGFEVDGVETAPDDKNKVIVAFKERYVAENFINGSSDIPGAGKLDLSWAPNPPIPASATTTTNADSPASMTAGKLGAPISAATQVDGDVAMGENAGVAPPEAKEEEYDVADDDDRWMAS
ncbi:hypothetical protein K490DRAFT_72251 [Saccharata proteae CBS 121410]|uniref:C3H1-type domain-containing protein n=1 Tax=Saccharata proteae CBS 121410 TaxID=1314787 RepID=A0A6A5YCU6_9PEZI|nr:hypothetical protein K490DRAFT_72251 [Saccharata proteae CBS 121410]